MYRTPDGGRTWNLEQKIPLAGDKLAMRGGTLVISKAGSIYPYYERTDKDGKRFWAPGDAFEVSLSKYDKLQVSLGSGSLLAAGPLRTKEEKHSPKKVGVYELADQAWSQVALLDGSDTTYMDEFGSPLALDGDVLVVGARDACGYPDQHGYWNCTEGGVSLGDAGVAYVFQRSEGGNWSQTAKVFPPNPGDGYFFPTVLSVSGDRVVMTNGNPAMPQPQDVGSVSVYGPAH